MIEARGLTKRYGRTVAVNDLSFRVEAGVVTGFLGPNGAGKSTTMRMILGLDRPSAGVALVHGRPFAELRYPMHEVGALLDARAAHGGRKVGAHLHVLAVSNGISKSRVDQVLTLTGLHEVAGRRVGGLSLGMSQRLGLAAAMLGDPGVLLFDEPVNGLDPEGIVWIRNFMKALAAEGRTVLVSSHLMTEMALTAQSVIVIGRGRLIAQSTTQAFIDQSSVNHVRVKSPQQEKLAAVLEAAGHPAAVVEGYLEVQGVQCAAVGDLAAKNRLTIHELFEDRASLEEAFMELTRDSVEFQAAAAGPVPVGQPGQPTPDAGGSR